MGQDKLKTHVWDNNKVFQIHTIFLSTTFNRTLQLLGSMRSFLVKLLKLSEMCDLRVGLNLLLGSITHFDTVQIILQYPREQRFSKITIQLFNRLLVCYYRHTKKTNNIKIVPLFTRFCLVWSVKKKPFKTNCFISILIGCYCLRDIALYRTWPTFCARKLLSKILLKRVPTPCHTLTNEDVFVLHK